MFEGNMLTIRSEREKKNRRKLRAP